MTRKLSFTTAVAVAALSVGAPAAFGGVHAGGEAAAVLAQPDPMIEDGFAQAIAQASVTGIRDAHERGVVADQGVRSVLGIRDAHERGVVPNQRVGSNLSSRDALTERYRDSFYRADPPRGTVPVSVTTSGNDIEWPQIGVGLGIGLLLALGFGLVMRAVQTRPFAH